MKKMVLNQTEYDSILLALKDTTSKRLSQRFYSVLYYLEGYKHYEIANLLKIDTHTVSIYIKKYKVGGINGLIERKYSPGTPRFVTIKPFKKHGLSKESSVSYQPMENMKVLNLWVS